MLRHLVLLRLVDDADPAAVDDLVAALERLPALIPEVRGYEVRRDAGLADDNADVVVVADFDDAEGFRTYRDHPQHQQVLAVNIRPILASRTAAQVLLDG